MPGPHGKGNSPFLAHLKKQTYRPHGGTHIFSGRLPTLRRVHYYLWSTVRGGYLFNHGYGGWGQRATVGTSSQQTLLSLCHVSSGEPKPGTDLPTVCKDFSSLYLSAYIS